MIRCVQTAYDARPAIIASVDTSKPEGEPEGDEGEDPEPEGEDPCGSVNQINQMTIPNPCLSGYSST